MANKHIKRCQTLLFIRKTEFEPSVGYLLASTRMAIIKKTVTSAGEVCGRNRSLYALLVGT